MNEKICKLIVENKEKFIPHLFTKKQVQIMEQWLTGAPLTKTEQTYLYATITKKVDALSLVREELYITGQGMIPERVEEAKKMLRGIGKPAFISGSFLFSKEYNDIDIFIIKKRGYSETWDGNNHLISLSLKKLRNPVFQSLSLISVSTFPIPQAIEKKKPTLHEIMSLYHESIIEIMDKEKKTEALRSLVFKYFLFCKDMLLTPIELDAQLKTIGSNEITSLVKEFFKKFFSKDYLYVVLHEYIQTLNDTILSVKRNEHLILYKNAYEELIYEKQRNQAEVA